MTLSCLGTGRSSRYSGVNSRRPLAVGALAQSAPPPMRVRFPHLARPCRPGGACFGPVVVEIVYVWRGFWSADGKLSSPGAVGPGRCRVGRGWARAALGIRACLSVIMRGRLELKRGGTPHHNISLACRTAQRMVSHVGPGWYWQTRSES